MSNKQTSIEWLESTIKSILVDNVSAIRYKEMILALVSQAKAMHKEEINKAAYDGYYTEGMCDIREYYNETYGQQ